MTTYTTPISFCPQCNYKMDSADPARNDEGKPEPGDSSVCLNCGQLLVFDGELILRTPTREEIADLMNAKDKWDTIEKAQQFVKQRGRYR